MLYFKNIVHEYLKKKFKKIIKQEVNNCFNVDSLKVALIFSVIPKKYLKMDFIGNKVANPEQEILS